MTRLSKLDLSESKGSQTSIISTKNQSPLFMIFFHTPKLYFRGNWLMTLLTVQPQKERGEERKRKKICEYVKEMMN